MDSPYPRPWDLWPLSWVKVDDDNPGLTYSGGWGSSSTSLDGAESSALFGGTAHSTNVAGSTVAFNFTGVAVAVYGAIRSDREALYQNNLRSKYTVDGSSPTYSFGLNLDGVDTNPDDKNKTIVYGIQFFQSPVLGIGEHNLVVTYDPTAEFNTTHFWIDYMEYLPNLNATSTPPAESKSASSTLSPTVFHTITTKTSSSLTSSVAVTSPTKSIISLSPSSIGTSTSSSSVSALATASTTTPTINAFDTRHHKIVTAIIGVAAGSIVLLIVGLSLFLSLRKRWQRLRSGAGATMEPFMHPHPLMTSIAESSKGNNNHIQTEGTEPLLIVSPSTPSLPMNTVEVLCSQDVRQRHTGSQLAVSQAATVQPHFHEGGGVDLQGGPLQDVSLENDIPPVYRQYWLDTQHI